MLVIDDLTLRIAGRALLEDASAQVPDGARVGLIGRNGAGKSTLFRAIAGDIAPEHGTIALPARARIGRLPQEAPDGPERLIDLVLAADRERTALIAEAEAAHDPHRIAEIQTRLADIGAHAAPARAAGILAGLGFSHDDQQRAVNEFSGGWRMRVALAAVLFAEPDLLLLDEPTNYLDLEGTLWLEDHLARYPRTVIVISHDRDLIDNAVDSILHLDGAPPHLLSRRLLRVRAPARASARRSTRSSRKSRRRSASTSSPSSSGSAPRPARRARRSRGSSCWRSSSRRAARVADEVREIVIPDPDRLLSPPIIAFDGVAAAYEPGKPVLRRVTLRIDNDDRIALLGANGNGKSTLTKLISGRLAPSEGRITRADRLEVAYFAQHQLDELDPAASAYDHVRALMRDAPEAKIRARAGAIGFPGEAADTPVANLSGGEKSRLLLGLACFDAPHLVVLDEPTNHLDIDSRAALIEAINAFAGAVILVSHDRYLLEACADRLWLVADGTVAPFDGDLDDYRALVLSRARDETERDAKPADRPSRSEARRAAAERRAELAPLKRRIAALETEMGKLRQAHRRDRSGDGRSEALRARSRPRRDARQGARRRGRRARRRRGAVAGAQRRVRERRRGLIIRRSAPT